MPEESRSTLTFVLWLFSAIVLDALLDNLSDDDLLELKRRLSDGEDEPHYLGDDGELVRRR